MTDLRNIVEKTLVPHTAFQDARRRLDQCFNYAENAAEPICIAIIGESRTGKSRALEECEAAHPTVRLSDGLTNPILRVKTPSKPTVKGLAELMLRTLGDPRHSFGTEQAKTARLQTLMRNTRTRMVMIDEFQHFYDKGSRKVMHHVTDWLKILADDSKVALAVAGLNSCRAVIEQNEQLAGRFLSPVLMPRFDWTNDAHREEFQAILAAFHEALGAHFDMPELGREDMAFRCYCGTGGLMGYLTKFLRQAVWDALDADTRTISLEDLAHAHNESVWAKDGPMDIQSPFGRKFSVLPDERLLARVAQIGTPTAEIELPRQPRRQPAKERTARDVLSAS